jgi:hypothetical protein
VAETEFQLQTMPSSCQQEYRLTCCSRQCARQLSSKRDAMPWPRYVGSVQTSPMPAVRHTTAPPSTQTLLSKIRSVPTNTTSSSLTAAAAASAEVLPTSTSTATKTRLQSNAGSLCTFLRKNEAEGGEGRFELKQRSQNAAQAGSSVATRRRT